MGTRSRTLKYLPGHELRFGIAPVSRHEVTGDVVEAVCLFCRHFGREQRADKKRKSARTVKFFRDSFRPDQYTQHHQLQHPMQWNKYKHCSDDEKRDFFSSTNARENALTTGVDHCSISSQCTNHTADVVLLPKTEQLGRCFDVKAAIVEVVAVLAVGVGPVHPTVQTRDRLVYQDMTHHNYDGEQPSTCPRWSPPPNTFEKCYVIQSEPPIYRVVLYSMTQVDFVMEMAAGGLSSAQIAASVASFRRHAPMLLRDLVGNGEKIGLPWETSGARAVERTKEVFGVDKEASPEYSEAQTAEFVRLGVAASLSIVARLLEESWAFSLELCTVAQHSKFSYLDVRVKFYNQIGGLRSAHLLAIPKYISKCDIMMFRTLDRVLTALLPEWKKKLLGITTTGEIPFPARLVDVVKHFQNAASGSMLYRTTNCIDQLQRILHTFYAAIDKGIFLQSLKQLSEYIRKEPRVLAEMKRLPGYWEQFDSEVHCASSTPVVFGQEIDMLVAHNAFLRGHLGGLLNDVALSSDASLSIPESWWVGLEVVHWITARVNAVFGVLQEQHATISQQAIVIVRLAEECSTGLQAHIRVDTSSVPQTSSNEYISFDNQVVLSKTNLIQFVLSSSELARDMVKHGDNGAVKSAAESFGTASVNMIASLVELSVSLKQQNVACASNANARFSRTTVVTDVLPPVMPHELAQLSSDEFDDVVEAHDGASRGTLQDADMEVIREEHELLCRTVAENENLRNALEKCTQGTRFDVAWRLLDGRFKSLEAFAGGLATVGTTHAVPLNDRSARDLVLCPKDMEEARLLLAYFELESALHAQQFQSLTKLQEEIYERELGNCGLMTGRYFNFDACQNLDLGSFSAGDDSWIPSRKDSLVAAALEASMRSVRLCGINANTFNLEEHQRWCVETVKERVVFKVSAPEARGTYLQKHTTYLVTQEAHQEGVRRRFRDFEWLRVVLHARYVGLLVPSLPEKTTTAAVLKTAAFMQSRMRGLQRFLNDIMQSPYLRSDAAVASFLGEPGDEATWEAMRTETAVMDNAGDGHMRWLQRILCEHIASSPENEISVFKRHVEQRARLLGELAACTKRLADKSAAMAKDVSTLDAIFAGWQLAETGAGSFEARNDGPLVALLDKCTATISGWSQVEKFQPAIYDLLLVENIKYLLHQAIAMKQMLLERERAVAGESSPERNPSPPPSESPASSRTSGFSVASFTSAASSAASRFMSAVEPPSLSFEEQQRRARHTNELITRALIAEEMQRFRTETTEELEHTMNHFCCAKAQLSKRSGAVWREYLKTFPADPQALAQSTKELLDSASTSCTPSSPSAADAF